MNEAINLVQSVLGGRVVEDEHQTLPVLPAVVDPAAVTPTAASARIELFEGSHEFLSLAFASPVEITFQGRTFVMPTALHAYQASKVAVLVAKENSLPYLDAISKADIKKALWIGTRSLIDVYAWEGLRLRCMSRVMELKFAADTELARLLVDTGEAVIAPRLRGEQDPSLFWGKNDADQGENHLGEILMERRQMLRSA